MLTALLLSLTLAASPKVYDSGSTVTVSEKSVVLSRDDFKYAVVGLVDRSSLVGATAIRDSLIESLRKSVSTCSTQVDTKDTIIAAEKKRVEIANKVTAVVRDSSKVAVKSSYWDGFRTGSIVTVVTEAVIILCVWGYSALHN